MGRSPISCSDQKDNEVIKRGPWSPEEDKVLVEYVEKHGQGSWQRIAEKSGLNRCGKSCRLRWTNYLRPDIKRGGFSDEEEFSIIKLHQVLGNNARNVAIVIVGVVVLAGGQELQLTFRDGLNEIKNFWNTSLRKKLIRSGIDPKTHKPISDLNLLLSAASNNLVHNLMNPLDPALILKASATEIAKIQLQNLLQARNSTTLLPYFQGISQLRDSIPYNMSLINGANATNLLQPQGILADLNNIISMANPFQCFEGGISPGSVQDNNINNFTNSLPNSLLSVTPEISTVSHLESFEAEISKVLPEPIHNLEYSLPSLVSVTPESSNVNQMESSKQCIMDTIPTQTLDQSNVFEYPWEKFLDDEACSSLWKDIFWDDHSAL